MNVKIKWLREKMRLMDMQGMIISDPINIYYLTGIPKEIEGTLLITRKENIYITDSRYIEAVNRVLTVYDGIIVYNVKNIEKDDYENFFSFCENVGFEEEYITYAKYKEYMHVYKINNFVETDNFIKTQRMIKDEEEIEYTKKACDITDKCFTHLCDYIKEGMTEKEIALEIERFFKLNGADGLAFDSIVASGRNSSMPHAVPTDKKIEENDIILLDFGCRYKGYCSDMTRTIFMNEPSQIVKNVYNLVLKNQEKTLEDIKEGVNARILTMMVESDLKVNGYTLDHSLGHGVGLEIHEKPIIGKKDYLLRENTIVTVEPGIYLPGKFGIRIEDTVLVTKACGEKLTHSDKNYIILNRNS